MPIYEYRCNACGEGFELLVRNGSPAAACPACRSDRVERLISVTAVSSDQTQSRNLAGAKKRVAAQRYDRQYEDHKTYHHEHDHD
jgi:putative FmdB family regulatory protein